MKDKKNTYYVLMTALVVVWGIDYVVVKLALGLLEPLSVLFFKYIAAFLLVLPVKLRMDGRGLIRKEDIWLYVLCVIFGEIIYYFCEYKAMDYLPVSLISIIVAFTPAVSVIFERVIYKKRVTLKIIAGIAVCVLGVALIIGVDIGALLNGKLIGYLLAFICIFAWNAYNFITFALRDGYTTVTLTLNQIICTLLLLSPYMAYTARDLPGFTHVLVLQLLFLGLFNSGVGFLIFVEALHVLGPTATVLFSNFIPVTTTIFGWFFLKETISPLQAAGGVIVILAGYIVIKEKGKTEVYAGV